MTDRKKTDPILANLVAGGCQFVIFFFMECAMVWSKLIFVWWTCQLLLLLLLLVVEVTHSYLFSAPLQVCPPHRPSPFACPPARRRCGSDHHGGGSHHHDAAAAADEDDGNHIVPPRVSPSLPLPSALPPSVVVPMQRRNVLWQLGITAMSSSSSSLGMMMFDTKSAMAAFSDNNNNSSDDTDDDDDDTTTMVTQLFNTDGSLKDTGTVVAASVRPVTLSLEEEEVVVARSSSLWVDGKRLSSDTTTTTTTTNSRKVIGNNRRSSIVIRYDLPTKWDSSNYLDTTTQERACTHISVYRVPYHPTPTNHGTASSSSIAVSDILHALPENSAVGAILRRADLMSGRIRRVVVVPQDKNDDSDSVAILRPPPPIPSYSELDFAVAPTTCSGGEAEDLRLGFCPYDRILLVSAIVMADTTTTTTQTLTVPPPPAENDNNNDGTSYLYLLIVESTRAEWQRANAELRRVRSSFTVLVHSSE
jgi:hypothetical protein